MILLKVNNKVHNLDKDNMSLTINELSKSGVLAASDERQLNAFCCACCRLIWDELPVEARRSLEVAERYVRGEINLEEVRIERRKLWAFCNAQATRNESAPYVYAVRAVICCLYDRHYAGDLEELDPYYEEDHLYWTMTFCNFVRKIDAQVYRQLLTSIFAPT